MHKLEWSSSDILTAGACWWAASFGIPEFFEGPVCLSVWNFKYFGLFLAAETPDNGGGDLLLSNDFLQSCLETFSVPARGYEANSRAFPIKHLNIVDPLKENNNLGRSVSKGRYNFPASGLIVCHFFPSTITQSNIPKLWWGVFSFWSDYLFKQFRNYL